MLPEKRLSFCIELETLKELVYPRTRGSLQRGEAIITALLKMAKPPPIGNLSQDSKNISSRRRNTSRLEKILKSHGESTRGPKCKGMEGVIKEGDEMIEEDAEDEVRDAGLIAAAQRVEHYEMAGYGCAGAYAEMLGDRRGAQLL